MGSSTSQHKDLQAVAIEATIATIEAAMEEQLDAIVSPATPNLQNTQGAELQFMPSSLINGVKCAKVELDDVKDEVDYWQQAVLCFVLGANPLFAVISLSKIGSIIATPIKTDKYTRDTTMLKYARLLIEVNLEGLFPEFMEFINENGVLTRQQVKFEWVPTKCSHCLMYGHEETFCRKKERVRKEWKSIPREEAAALATTPLPLVSQARNPEVKFTPVTRRVAATHTQIASPNRNPQSQNQYYLLSMDPYIEATVINGTKYARIEYQDVAAEIAYRKHVVICSVLRANPQLGIIEGYSQYEIDKVISARNGVYLIRFNSIQDKEAVLSKGIYYFDNKPFIAKAWNEHLDLDTASIKSLPICVKFLILDVKYWGVESLSELGSLLGIPLKTDKPTMEKVYLNYARLFINISLYGPLP
ncbi:hypothetical protein Cgig2_006449 [Carnegiea gigantea]|uniref:DUF4283 domain-containing protein n=1 Tax=Carnegiea gigantea TaxID=171969 RepID=A0A9Q1QCS2_9CARY|nr:hypothetical protein Cgig2_006449 [Carnegiea gigantea]